MTQAAAPAGPITANVVPPTAHRVSAPGDQVAYPAAT